MEERCLSERWALRIEIYFIGDPSCISLMKMGSFVLNNKISQGKGYICPVFLSSCHVYDIENRDITASAIIQAGNKVDNCEPKKQYPFAWKSSWAYSGIDFHGRACSLCVFPDPETNARPG